MDFGRGERCYIRYESAGDQFVGRAVSGLPILKKEFGISMPYFDFTSCEDEDEKDAKEREVNKWILDRIPMEAKLNQNVLCMMKCLVASLAFHDEFLRENLHRNSEVRCNVFMTDSIPHANHVQTAYPWTRTSDSPDITGIPPHTTMLAEIAELRSLVLELKDELKSEVSSTIKTTITSELNAREVGGAGFVQSTLILQKIEELVEQNKERMQREQEKLCRNVDSATLFEDGVHLDVSDDWDIEPEDDIEIILDEDNENATNNDSRAGGSKRKAWNDKQVREETSKQLKRRRTLVGYHHGKFSTLPSTWTFPESLTVINLINMWHRGNTAENIPPYKLLTGADVKHIQGEGRGGKRGGEKTLSRMTQVMKKIEEIGKQKDVWEDKVGKWSAESVTELWNGIWESFQPYLASPSTRAEDIEKCRKGQINWRTCYNFLYKKGLLTRNKVRKGKTVRYV